MSEPTTFEEWARGVIGNKRLPKAAFAAGYAAGLTFGRDNWQQRLKDELDHTANLTAQLADARAEFVKHHHELVAQIAEKQAEIERLKRELEDRPDSGGLARLHAFEAVVRVAKRAIALIMSQPGEFTTDEVGLDDLVHAIAELDRLTGERQSYPEEVGIDMDRDC